jgi:hypothetical protein
MFLDLAENLRERSSGVIESSGITKLVMSAKGEGRLKVGLKPKTRL